LAGRGPPKNKSINLKRFQQKRMPYPQEVEAAKDFQTQQQQQQ
jgi:hypothetical protein